MDGGSWHSPGDKDQDHPQGKEMQKAKWLSEEALQLWNEEKPKAKEERKDLNAEFQRIARRDKKACLNDQSK